MTVRGLPAAIFLGVPPVATVACGTSPGTRVVSGGQLGACSGAATGGSAGTGALVGGGIGAAGGALIAPGRRH